jgi:uncharacterized protein YjbI with pentapeptide repeats
MGANFGYTNLIRTILTGVNMSAANLKRASQTRALILGVEMGNTNLQGAKVRDADLNCQANLQGADLRLPILSEAGLRGVFTAWGDAIPDGKIME